MDGYWIASMPPSPLLHGVQVTLTAIYIVSECPDFNQQQISSYRSKSVKGTLSGHPSFSVYLLNNFLRNCMLLNKM